MIGTGRVLGLYLLQNAVLMPAQVLSFVLLEADTKEGFLCGDCPVRCDTIYLGSLLVD